MDPAAPLTRVYSSFCISNPGVGCILRAKRMAYQLAQALENAFRGLLNVEEGYTAHPDRMRDDGNSER
jgi:hypothetical protein